MFKKLKAPIYKFGAAFTVGFLAAQDAQANTFNDIAKNVVDGTSDTVGLMSAFAYFMGIVLMVLGLLKIKDHVENPSQTPLKDGFARLLIGGGLFGLTLASEAMFETFGSNGTSAKTAKLSKVELGVN